MDRHVSNCRPINIAENRLGQRKTALHAHQALQVGVERSLGLARATVNRDIAKIRSATAPARSLFQSAIRIGVIGARVDNQGIISWSCAMLDPDLCWQAVCARDAMRDNQFVFAVRSTGIYCRPSCPARRPLRRNVSFHADAQSAEAAGFRPCKRCSPQGASPAEQLDALVAAACRLLVEQDNIPTLVQLAARIGLSPSHLARAFKARTGLTPKAWADANRRTQLQASLPQAESVLDAALAAGYCGTRALYEHSDGLSPAQRRRQGAGETLRYAIAACPLGQLLLASSAKGVCALLFGDTAETLQSELRQRFAAAQLQRDDADLGSWLQQVIAQIETPQRAAQLPLDLRGTVFQQQVWRALRQIPVGQTRSYGELAASIGSHPRAVARACASNPLGLLVPCHRVIGANGALSGYRWGLARKVALLEGETLAADGRAGASGSQSDPVKQYAPTPAQPTGAA
jgi:AraC family transcriptional regulator of adaptative response/methylated-DNA-[protein]-cysteine methyltransferase